jgi:hypothetical protein
MVCQRSHAVRCDVALTANVNIGLRVNNYPQEAITNPSLGFDS